MLASPLRRVTGTLRALLAPSPSTVRTPLDADAGANGALMRIARAAVALSELSPELVRLAAEIRAGAGTQLERTRSIAGATRATTSELTEVTERLHDCSTNIGKVVELIESLASQTRMVSFNANIEAARAGASGAVFAVVASEVQQLSERTARAAKDVGGTVSAISTNVDRVIATVGGGSNPTAGAAPSDESRQLTLFEVNEEVQEVAAVSEVHYAVAEVLNGLGEKMRAGCEDLILALGSYRFDVHRRAQDALQELVAAGLGTKDPYAQEALLGSALTRHGYFELMYVTDPQGVQTTNNVTRGEFNAAYGTTGYGRDWSSRPWFRAAASSQALYVSDIYRSAATDDFCFTLSAPLHDAAGRWVGVLGADVRLGSIL